MIYPEGEENTGQIELRGKILKVNTEPGWRNKKIQWWVAKVETEDGTVVKLRIDPTWRTIKPPVTEGDIVSVTGYIPPYWRSKGLNEIMVCSMKIGNKLATFRECNKSFAAKNKKGSFSQSQILTGKVTDITQLPGFKRKNIKWWVIKLSRDDGSIVEVRVAPLFRFSTIPITNGDIVRVKWFIPPAWSNGIMACEIENLTNGKILKIRNCPGGSR